MTDEHIAWPELPYEPWRATKDTLHLWTQVVGKIRLALAAPVNHWWHVPLYVTARGLTTSAMPYDGNVLQIDFDLLAHELVIHDSTGRGATMRLEPRSVADFYQELMSRLAEIERPVHIWSRPVELVEAIPFEDDVEHQSYDAAAVERFFHALAHADRVMHRFRGGFRGKASPVHFFWGSFDHAVTLFSGRHAPPHPGGIPNLADRVTRESYSAELASCGFWPGDERYPRAAFYGYAYPSPDGYSECSVRTEGAYFNPDLSEFVLDYDVARAAPDPDAAVLEFFEDAQQGAARLMGWDVEPA